MTKGIAILALVFSSFMVLGGCSSQDSTAEAPPKGAPPEVKQADPSMKSPEERARAAGKPSEGPDGGM